MNGHEWKEQKYMAEFIAIKATFIKIFFSRTTWPNATKLKGKHLRLKGLKFIQNRTSHYSWLDVVLSNEFCL